ncbi:hypothetical protein NE237_023608 [Protea cynaroides]|uniref:Uncharacterized protein n=1 Tax=Protea cynaroides TaxID=273540 RepID=A0A9Q0HHD1_9MAGN|nr:hypothetical protein NE237_023608 [Protea cynaroides]
MGICISIEPAKEREDLIQKSEAMVIDADGKLQKFKEQTKVRDVISQNPNCFLCNAESIYVDSCFPPLPDTEELQFGQIYFLLPLTKQNIPVTLPDLCTLAIRTASVLRKRDRQMQSSPFSSRLSLSLRVGSRKDRKSPADSSIRRASSL